MIVQELGFFDLSDMKLRSNEDYIIIESDRMLQKIIETYGYHANIYLIYPCDGRQLRSIMLDFRPNILADNAHVRFLRIDLAPSEIHIIKKQFDELFAF